jgi:hypothetical protein
VAGWPIRSPFWGRWPPESRIVVIIKELKALCFDNDSQVFILIELGLGFSYQLITKNLGGAVTGRRCARKAPRGSKLRCFKDFQVFRNSSERVNHTRIVLALSSEMLGFLWGA